MLRWLARLQTRRVPTRQPMLTWWHLARSARGSAQRLARPGNPFPPTHWSEISWISPSGRWSLPRQTGSLPVLWAAASTALIAREIGGHGIGLTWLVIRLCFRLSVSSPISRWIPPVRIGSTSRSGALEIIDVYGFSMGQGGNRAAARKLKARL